MHDHFLNNLKTVHCPLSSDLALDEVLTCCLSKCGFSVFMPNKRHTRGVRIYLVVDHGRLTTL